MDRQPKKSKNLNQLLAYKAFLEAFRLKPDDSIFYCHLSAIILKDPYFLIYYQHIIHIHYN
jgi:hypothetical protein